MTTTLTDYLNQAYSYAHKLSDAPPVDPVEACAAAGFVKADVQAVRDALFVVENRDVVSRTQRTFLDRVLSAMP